MPATSILTVLPARDMVLLAVQRPYERSVPNSTLTWPTVGATSVYWATRGCCVGATDPCTADQNIERSVSELAEAATPNPIRASRTTAENEVAREFISSQFSLPYIEVY